MVQNLALVSHGEPNWDVKVNAAIKALNEVGGGSVLAPMD